MPETTSRYLTLSQVAARTGRHPELLRQWCASGRIPCQRLGGAWVLLEEDVALLDRMATRTRRRRAAASPSSPRRRLLAAVFDDPAHAEAAKDGLRRQLAIADTSIESAPLGLQALAALGLTVVAGHVPEEASLDARRILASFGGRIVADLDEAQPAPPPAAVGAGRRRALRAG